MIKSILRRLKEEHIKAFREQKGQSIIIITFAFLGLIAMLGLALDLGLVYIEQVRISRTTDAAALAAVVELPFEEESMRRAIEYIQLNGYRVGEDTEVRVRGCINRPSGLKNVSSAELTASATIPLTPTNSITDSWVYIPAIEPAPRAIFVIDTLGFEPVDYNTNGTVKTKNQEVCTGTVGSTSALYGSANKLRVAGKVNVDMNFMQFFGFKRVPVQDDAVGENVTNLDIAVVFDKSGSMDFETNCFGCWNPYTSAPLNDVIQNPYPLNGAFSALARADNTNLCTGAPAYVQDNFNGEGAFKRYLVHEAEYYSKEGPLPQGWLYSQRSPGRGYWALQKKLDGSTPLGSNAAYIRAHPLTTYSQSSFNEYPQLQGASYNDECFSTGVCWKARAEQLGEPTATKDEVPYVEYDFTPQWAEPTHVWVRAVGGSGYSFEWYGQSPKQVVGGNLLPWKTALYWQVSSGTFSSTVSGGPWDNLVTYNTTIKDGVDNNGHWRWIKLGSVSGLTNGQRATLRLYQGATGFNIDRIIFTNNSSGSIGDAIPNTGNRIGSGTVNAEYNALKAVLQQNSGRGPNTTAGSATRESCNICNPAFGQTVTSAQCRCPANHTEAAGTGVGTGQGCTVVPAGGPVNQLTNDLFSDIQPMRSAKEAVKNFAKRLDPKFDQVGFVVFSASVDNAYREKLQCLRFAQRLGDRTRCYDEANTQVFTYTNIFKAIEKVGNVGNTNIAQGMVEGLEELGVNTPYNSGITSDCDLGSTSNGLNRGSNNKKSCDRRGGARRILILMTDGSPNEPDPADGTSYCPSGLPASATWQGTGGSTLAYNCAVYYAQQAANNGVTVYTIGIGAGVNQDLLRVMAEGRSTVPGHTKVYIEGAKGKFYLASTQQDLDEIFKDILNNVVVRLVG